MRKLILLFVMIISTLGVRSQTNLFTIGDNGHFETPESVNGLIYSGGASTWTLEHSNQGFSGSHSLKLTCSDATGNSLNYLITQNFGMRDVNKEYLFKAKILVPSGAVIRKEEIGNVNEVGIFISVGGSSITNGSAYACGSNSYNTGVDLTDEGNFDHWIDISSFVRPTSNGTMHLGISLYDHIASAYFYIDDIEVYEFEKIQISATVDDQSRSVTNVSATGGFTGLSGYSFSWSDSYTGADRTNLSYGNYTLYAKQSADNLKPYMCHYEGFLSFNFPRPDPIPLCTTYLPLNQEGELKFNKLSGQLVFKPDLECLDEIDVGCVNRKTDVPLLGNVISASAATFKDDWKYDASMYYNYGMSVSESNPYENGEKGKWRQEASYVFKTSKIDRDKNFNSGTYHLAPFNWQYTGVNERSGWLMATRIEKYSPNGDPLQERNALGIASTAKFGYYDAVPYLIAQNANYNSVLFESFENAYSNNPTVFEEGISVSGAASQDTKESHAGLASLKVAGSATIPLRAFRISEQVKNKGLLVKLWMKGNIASTSLQANVVYDGNTQSTLFSKIARTGEWTLFSATILPGSFMSIPLDNNVSEDEQVTFSLQIDHTTPETIWLDDVRVQPYDAEMTTYVYDKSSLRLLATLDDQHFGLYYQYNPEGKLIRKMIETKNGIQTIQETQYNAQKVNKTDLVGN